MKTALVLDYSKWRSGGELSEECRFPENITGVGPTGLLNSWGFSCCLGQFLTQIKNDIDEFTILNKGYPRGINKDVHGLSFLSFGEMYNTQFSESAAKINDTNSLTPLERLQKLRTLCSENNYELVVINLPSEMEALYNETGNK